ncbi:MAG TPA: TspO/MBR family protein [Methyloceanibacter sp.]|jgi:tryptophan-rich sensory protein
MDASSILALIVFVGACFIAAAMGALFPPGDWYERLAKPSWRPPNWLFAPVWTAIYLTIAVSGWLVWRKYGLAGAAGPLAIYVLQLVLNAAWTPIFFGLRRPDLAFFEIIVLWIAIVATIVIFYPIHPAAALLLVPYMAWVTFAAALNFSVWRLNQFPTSRKTAGSYK